VQWRGSSIRVKFDLLALESLGMRVDLLTMPFGEDDPQVRSTVYRVPRLPGFRELAIGPSFSKLLHDVLILFKSIQLAYRCRYDVIHATEEGGAIAWLVGRLTGARCIYEKHSDPGSYGNSGIRNVVMKAYGLLEAFIARRADLVICTGPGLQEQVRRYAPKARIHHIPDIPSSAVEPGDAEVERLSRELQIESTDVAITYVGSFAVYQGIQLLFDAIPLVLKAHPRARFMIIGGSEQEIADLRGRLGSLQSRVVLPGKIDPDRLPVYLRASDILLAPRRSGVNTPLKVLDYFKAGRAIVATDTEANRLILDSSCAMLSDYTADAFADSIGQLVDDPELRARLGEEGRRRFCTNYTFEVFNSRLDAAYRDLLGDRYDDETVSR
jgi:glycosyltransferase involved in cell wall biosynthesis